LAATSLQALKPPHASSTARLAENAFTGCVKVKRKLNALPPAARPPPPWAEVNNPLSRLRQQPH
jgi:hypothetical protein